MKGLIIFLLIFFLFLGVANSDVDSIGDQVVSVLNKIFWELQEVNRNLVSINRNLKSE